jgi:hypothetical protein
MILPDETQTFVTHRLDAGTKVFMNQLMVNSADWRGNPPLSLLIRGSSGRWNDDETVTIETTIVGVSLDKVFTRIHDPATGDVTLFQMYQAIDFNDLEFGEPVDATSGTGR